jgi:site-specific DNA recombinase
MTFARKSKNTRPEVRERLRVAGYVRVSTEEQAENPEGSIRNQEERIRQLVQFKNMEAPFGDIAHVFIERGRSGKNTNRPELQKLLAAVRRREVDLIVVTELSRLSRSIKDFAEIWDLMQDHECGFMSLRENFDTTTAAGEMVLFTLAGIAQFERKQVSERVKAGFVTRAARGLFNGGRVPIGYRVDPDKPGHFVIDEEMAEVVRRAYAAFIEQGSLSATAKWLNERGLRARKVTPGGGGKPRLGFFTVDSLHRLLTNRSYLGLRVYRDLKGRELETKAAWPALVSEELFERVDVQLKKNHCRYKPASMQHRFPFLLSGLLECGTCHDRLPGKSAHGSHGKIPYYEHSWATKKGSTLVKETFKCDPHRVLANRLEPLVWGAALEILQNPEVAKRIIAEAQVLHQKRLENPERTRLKKTLSSIDSQTDALTVRLGEIPSGVSAQPIYRQMEKLQVLRKETAEQLTRVEGSSGPMSAEVPAALADYEKFIAALRALDATDPENLRERETCRQLLHRLIHKIEVFPDRVRIHYFAGRDYIERDLQRCGSLDPSAQTGEGQLKNSIVGSSNTLTYGAPSQTRTGTPLRAGILSPLCLPISP